MIHPHTEVRFIDAEVGYGVFATQRIPRGTITWVQDKLDREFSPEALQSFDAAHRKILDRYSYRNAKGHYVFCWDHARFMNHSADATCLLTPYGLEIAVKDIPSGTELSNDYGCFNIIEPFSPKPEANGRDTIRHEDSLHCSADWDAAIATSLTDLPNVAQPLRRLLSAARWEELHEIAAGRSPQRSTAALYFSEK